jgi:hypothetical protein
MKSLGIILSFLVCYNFFPCRGFLFLVLHVNLNPLTKMKSSCPGSRDLNRSGKGLNSHLIYPKVYQVASFLLLHKHPVCTPLPPANTNFIYPGPEPNYKWETLFTHELSLFGGNIRLWPTILKERYGWRKVQISSNDHNQYHGRAQQTGSSYKPLMPLQYSAFTLPTRFC